jgi:methionyl-tRNA synthetase
VLTFAVRHWDGRVPTPGALRPADRIQCAQIASGFATVGALLEAVKLRAALQETMRLVRTVNNYLAQTPWFGVVQEDKAAAATTIYTALWAIDSLKVLLAPFVPFSAEHVHSALGYTQPLFGTQCIVTAPEGESAPDILVYDATPATGTWTPSTLRPGQPLTWSTPLYHKLDGLPSA